MLWALLCIIAFFLWFGALFKFLIMAFEVFLEIAFGTISFILTLIAGISGILKKA